MRVVVVETDDVEGYVDQIDRGLDIMKRIGSTGEVRVMRATFAGPNTGTVVVTVEFDDIAAMAADTAKLAGSKEYQNWLKGLDDFRVIASDSLYTEITP